MVRRYLTRTRMNRSAQTIEESMLNNFRQQAESLLAQLARQFADTVTSLQKDAAQSASGASSNNPASTFDDFSSAQARLFANTLSLLNSKPKIRTRTEESQRSINANQEFRLSHSQMLAEAAQTLQGGNKNS